MFRSYTPRPRPQVEAVHITRVNFNEVAEHFGATVHHPVEEHGRPYMSVTLPTGNGKTIRSKVGLGSVIIKHRDDLYTVTDIDFFDSEYQLTDPVRGAAPEHADLPHIAATAKALTGAGEVLAQLVGPWTPHNPNRNVSVGGLVLFPGVAGRVSVHWVNDGQIMVKDPVEELGIAARVLTQAGYKVSVYLTHLSVTPPK